MATRRRIPLELSVYIRYLHQKEGLQIKDIVNKYKTFSKSSIYRHAKKPIPRNEIPDLRKNNPGRPKKLSGRDERLLVRQVYKLRKSEGTFTSKRLQLSAGISHCSNKTIQRTLRAHGFKYLQSRRKGRMSIADLKKRVAFARGMLSKYSPDVWTKEICFYLDGKSFQYKTNPFDQARAPKSREWRKKSEGLNADCVSKGSKVGSGGKIAHYMVAICYGHGVVGCEQYVKMNGQYFAGFVQRNFKNMFANSVNSKGKLFIQDGDPSQNSKLAVKEINKIGAVQISIPPRSPDINPIENFFNLVERKLQYDAITKKITHETFEEFSERVRKTMVEFETAAINKIINSMHKRMKLIIKNKGQRLKY